MSRDGSAPVGCVRLPASNLKRCAFGGLYLLLSPPAEGAAFEMAEPNKALELASLALTAVDHLEEYAEFVYNESRITKATYEHARQICRRTRETAALVRSEY